jgi:hypothetical protein
MVDIEELPIIRSTPPSRQMTYNFNASSPKHAPSSQQVPRQQKTPSSQTSQHPPCSGETPLPQSVHSQHSLLEQTALSSPSLPARPSTRRGRYDSSPPSTTKATPSFIGRSTYKYSSSDPEGPLASPVLEFRSKVQSSPRYGLNYDDNELYSSSSPSISATSSPPGEQHSTKARGRPPNMLQLALKRAAGLESSDTQQPSVETPVKIPLPPRPKAVKPRSTIKIQEAPNSLAVRTGDGNKGTWLHSIQEGLSPHVSPHRTFQECALRKADRSGASLKQRGKHAASFASSPRKQKRSSKLVKIRKTLLKRKRIRRGLIQPSPSPALKRKAQ